MVGPLTKSNREHLEQMGKVGTWCTVQAGVDLFDSSQCQPVTLTESTQRRRSNRSVKNMIR